MSSELDDAPDDTVNNTDPFIVTDKMGNRLRWDENNATIHGYMYEIGEHCYRKQILVPFFEEGVVPLPNGRTALDDRDALQFVRQVGGVARPDKYSFMEPCPPTATRKTNFVLRSPGVTAPVDLTGMPKEHSTEFLVSEFTISKEEGKMTRVLTSVFGGTDVGDEALKVSRGVGREFHRLLLAEGASAEPIDLSLVVAEYDAVCRRGVDGRITADSLKAFLIEYDQKLIRTPSASRKTDLAEAEMINVIVFKDPDIRDRYATAIEVSAPTTLIQGQASSTR
jgi:hypothetical protein